jgi:hypothetical protein
MMLFESAIEKLAMLSCFLGSRRNIVATVNLGCRLDLKTIAMHARNAEYNPKVNMHVRFPTALADIALVAFRSRHHAYSRSENHSLDLRLWKDGRHRCQIRRRLAIGLS